MCEKINEKYDIPVIIGGDINNGENSSAGDGAYKKMLEWNFRDIRFLQRKQRTNLLVVLLIPS